MANPALHAGTQNSGGNATGTPVNTTLSPPTWSSTHPSAGDVAVLVLNLRRTTDSGAPSTPTGWTQQASVYNSANTIRGTVYTRVCDGTATDNPTNGGQITWANTATFSWCYAAYSNAASPGIDVQSTMQQNSTASTTMAAPSVTTSINNDLVLECFCFDGPTGQAYTVPSGFNDDVHFINTGITNGGVAIASLSYPTLGSAGGVSATLGTSRTSNSMTIALLAAPGGNIYSGTIIETGSAADTSNSAVVFASPLAESGSASDNPTIPGSYAGTMLESGSATDTLTSTGIFSGVDAESGSAADTTALIVPAPSVVTIIVSDDQPGQMLGGNFTRSLIRAFPLTLGQVTGTISGGDTNTQVGLPITPPTLPGGAGMTIYPNAWCDGPVCEPARAGIFTGSLDFHHTIHTNQDDEFFNERDDIANAFYNAGWLTALFGKRFVNFPYNSGLNGNGPIDPASPNTPGLDVNGNPIVHIPYGYTYGFINVGEPVNPYQYEMITGPMPGFTPAQAWAGNPANPGACNVQAYDFNNPSYVVAAQSGTTLTITDWIGPVLPANLNAIFIAGDGNIAAGMTMPVAGGSPITIVKQLTSTDPNGTLFGNGTYQVTPSVPSVVPLTGSHGTGTATFVDSTANAFTSGMVGSPLFATGGGAVPGWYLITGFTNATTVTLASNPGINSIASGTYVSSTGVITLVLNANASFSSGTVNLASLTGTGAFASLDGGPYTVLSVSGVNVTVQGPIGAGAATIKGGNCVAPFSGASWALGSIGSQNTATQDIGHNSVLTFAAHMAWLTANESAILAGQNVYAYVAPFSPHDPPIANPTDQLRFTADPNLDPLPSFNSTGTNGPSFYAQQPPFSANTNPTLLQIKAKVNQAEQAVLCIDRAISGTAANSGTDGLLATFNNWGILNKTVLFYTTDQGIQYGLQNWETKRAPFDGTMRVPFIAYWGKFGPAPGINNQVVMQIDMVPTIANLAGVTPPALQIDGVDIIAGSRQVAAWRWVGGDAGGNYNNPPSGDSGTSPAFDGVCNASTSYFRTEPCVPVSGACSITIAAPAVITFANAFVAGQPVSFTTTGSLPTGLTPGLTYYVQKAGLSTSSFQVSVANNGASVTTTGSQSGTQTLTYFGNMAVPTALSEEVLYNFSTCASFRGNSSAGLLIPVGSITGDALVVGHVINGPGFTPGNYVTQVNGGGTSYNLFYSDSVGGSEFMTTSDPYQMNNVQSFGGYASTKTAMITAMAGQFPNFYCVNDPSYAAATSNSGNLTLVEPARVQDGMLLLAEIEYLGVGFTIPAGWNAAAPAITNTVTSPLNSSACGTLMLWQVRSGPPNLTFTRTGGNIAQGFIKAYRFKGTLTYIDGQSAQATVASSTTISVPGFTAVTPNQAIFVFGAHGRNTSIFNVNSTLPAISSGTTNNLSRNDPYSAPQVGHWTQKDNSKATDGTLFCLGITADGMLAQTGQSTGAIGYQVAIGALPTIMVATFSATGGNFYASFITESGLAADIVPAIASLSAVAHETGVASDAPSSIAIFSSIDMEAGNAADNNNTGSLYAFGVMEVGQGVDAVDATGIFNSAQAEAGNVLDAAHCFVSTVMAVAEAGNATDFTNGVHPPLTVSGALGDVVFSQARVTVVFSTRINTIISKPLSRR